MKHFTKSILPLFILALVLFSSCSKNDKSPGLEYMPDMYRSPAIEEYVDYGEIRDRINDSIAYRLSAMLPPEGAIPYAMGDANPAFNFPYAYADTDEDYEKASLSNTNPIPYNEAVYNEGKVIFGKFCVHCHGPKGQSKGSVVENSAFPPPPHYSKVAGLTFGKMFHTLMYGKGNMGSHSSQLDKRELWTVAHYVRTLRDEQYDYASSLGKKATPEVAGDDSEQQPK